MPQQDMSWDTFTGIVESIPGSGYNISLQGEGEPSLHPQFEAMAIHISEQGHQPYSILNGSRVDAQRLSALFPTIGFSVDTLNEEEAKKTGRYNLPKVLRNIELLCEVMHPGRITIMTVDMGQALDDLRLWVKSRGFGRHIVQVLYSKSDYARRYTVNTQAIMPLQPSMCQYLQRSVMRFYTWEGKELPCCYIKDSSDFTTMADVRARLSKGEPVRCCAGCSQLVPLKRPQLPR